MSDPEKACNYSTDSAFREKCRVAHLMDSDQVPFNVSLPLLGVGAFTLMLSICFCCYLWRLKRNAFQETRGFTTKKFTPGGRNQNDICPVCLEEFERQEKIAVCRCHHGFHSKCLTQWLECRNTCPLCKAPVRNSARETTGLIQPTASSSR